MNEKILEEILLQNILQHADVGIHVINEDKKTIVYNENMANLEGLDKKDVLNKDLLKVFPNLDANSSRLIRVLETGEPIENSTQTYLNYKGKSITTINTTIPLKYKGEIIGALEVAKNITNVKELSDQLMDLQIELSNGNDKKHNGVKHYRFKDIIGNNKEFMKAIDIGRKASKTSSSVLIYGETGSGKELFAQSIHYEGIRRNKPFIAQNCAAIPDTLLEGILFGTEEGGFTGAVSRPGIFEQADGGTLLLDEINSMPLTLQAKLLRVLQEGYIRRVGGIKDIPVDARIIATTNEKPQDSIKKGTLRKDLFYRLNVVYISIPPLRDRCDDIPILCNYFIEKYNKELFKDVWMISDEVLELFNKYSWPGNVRELENAIESSMNYIPNDERVLKKEDFIACDHIFKDKKDSNIYEIINLNQPLPNFLGNIEKNIIQKELKENDYNITRTAEKIGIKRQTLQHKIKKYRL